MSRFKLVVSEALRSMGANISTSFAAATTVLIGMFLLGLLIALGTWVVSWSDHVKDQLQVKVFFVDNVKDKQINAVGSYLRADDKIKDYKFVSRADALARMQKRYPELTRDLPTNPLPASYEITPRKAEEVKQLSAAIRAQKFAGVERVKDGQQTSKRILQVARVIEVVFLVAVVILLIASVLLIANTIRLSIFARRREIEVMKLVGATNWFVRGPFMVEGLLCGVLGAFAAVVLLLLGKEIALPAILGHIDTTSSNDVRALGFTLTALILLAVGLVVGAVGSTFTLRRYLKWRAHPSRRFRRLSIGAKTACASARPPRDGRRPPLPRPSRRSAAQARRGPPATPARPARTSALRSGVPRTGSRSGCPSVVRRRRRSSRI